MNGIAHLAAANFSKFSTKSHFDAICDKLHHSACHKHLTLSNKTVELILIPPQKKPLFSDKLPWECRSIDRATICCAVSGWGKFCPRCCISWHSVSWSAVHLLGVVTTWLSDAQWLVGLLEHWQLILKFLSLEETRRLARLMLTPRVNQTGNTTRWSNATLLWGHLSRTLQVWKYRLPAATFSCLNHSCGS